MVYPQGRRFSAHRLGCGAGEVPSTVDNTLSGVHPWWSITVGPRIHPETPPRRPQARPPCGSYPQVPLKGVAAARQRGQRWRGELETGRGVGPGARWRVHPGAGVGHRRAEGVRPERRRRCVVPHLSWCLQHLVAHPRGARVCGPVVLRQLPDRCGLRNGGGVPPLARTTIDLARTVPPQQARKVLADVLDLHHKTSGIKGVSVEALCDEI